MPLDVNLCDIWIKVGFWSKGGSMATMQLLFIITIMKLVDPTKKPSNIGVNITLVPPKTLGWQ
jgi:hypothetical protein